MKNTAAEFLSEVGVPLKEAPYMMVLELVTIERSRA